MSCEPTPADLALVEAARRARLNAHAPMSGYHVGAALRTPDGDVITGCNVEDILLNLGCCAESVALFKAISDGYRQFEAVAVVTQGRPAAAPCGACRQLLASWKIERVVPPDPLDPSYSTSAQVHSATISVTCPGSPLTANQMPPLQVTGAATLDIDQDGYTQEDDCNDLDPNVYPGAVDVPYDGLDADCANDTDADADGDGFASSVYGGLDCDDGDPLINPGAVEIPNDGIDQDCDPSNDAGDSNCDCLDDDNDGEIDEDCDYSLQTIVAGEQLWTGWLDGNLWDSGSSAGSSDETVLGATVSGGVHYLAFKVTTDPSLPGGFRAASFADGTLIDLTSPGAGWTADLAPPPGAWQTTLLSNDAPPASCAYAPGVELDTLGASWLWLGNCEDPNQDPENWFVREVLICGVY